MAWSNDIYTDVEFIWEKTEEIQSISTTWGEEIYKQNWENVT